MKKNIVICLDGTNNSYDATNTNVVKIHALLDRTQKTQVSYYQTGIGTLPPPGMWGRVKRWSVTRLDLAFGWLLEEHVTSAYQFLMEHYEEGDQIYIFGFSRGAYTARVLAGMLSVVGLLGSGNRELVPFAWDMYRRSYKAFRANSSPSEVGNADQESTGREDGKPVDETSDLAKGFRETFGRIVSIRFLGLWDTVSSIGWVPWSPKNFPNTRFNPNVEIVRHAVALDERRTYFVQNLWAKEPPAGQDVLEVWFPGVHSDVGGGYKESEAGLSKITLLWMVTEAESAGLQINAAMVPVILPGQDTKRYVAPNAHAHKHESLHGLWWIAELIPKRIKDPKRSFEPRWILPRGRARYVSPGSKIHASVLERTKDKQYVPRNLPLAKQFEIID